MTTITIKDGYKSQKKDFSSISDFLWVIDFKLIYEEYLERKLQNVKNAPKSDFVNL